MTTYRITGRTFQLRCFHRSACTGGIGAPWCVPCRNLEPILTQLSSGVWAGKVRLLKVNVDECPGLVNRFSVMTVPTLILFVSGQPVERLTGLQTAAKITQKMDPYITNPASRA